MSENNSVIKCIICNKIYKNRNSLGNHRRKFHIANNSISPQTNSESLQTNSIIQPIIQKKNYKCKYCNKILSRIDKIGRAHV